MQKACKKHLSDHIWDNWWDDIFNAGAFAAASKFFEWTQGLQLMYISLIGSLSKPIFLSMPLRSS